MDDALAKAAELASVTEYGVDRYPKSRSFLEVLLDDLSSAEATVPVEVTVDGLVPEVEETVSELLLLDAIFADGAVMYLPGSPTFE